MGSIRLVQTAIGYLIPFTLFFVMLFAIEYFIELILGLISYAVGSSIKPNFPGPTDFIRVAISLFPDVWDLGTGIFYGSLGASTYFLYIIFAILDGLVAITIFSRLKDNIHDISKESIARSAARFGALAVITTSPTSDDEKIDYQAEQESSESDPPTYYDDPDDPGYG